MGLKEMLGKLDEALISTGAASPVIRARDILLSAAYSLGPILEREVKMIAYAIPKHAQPDALLGKNIALLRAAEAGEQPLRGGITIDDVSAARKAMERAQGLIIGARR